MELSASGAVAAQQASTQRNAGVSAIKIANDSEKAVANLVANAAAQGQQAVAASDGVRGTQVDIRA